MNRATVCKRISPKIFLYYRESLVNMSVEETRLDPVSEQAQDEYIIDTDFHLGARGEIIEYIEDDLIREKVENYGMPPLGGDLSYGYAMESTEDPEEFHGAALNADEIEEAMEVLCVDVAIVEPSNFIPFRHSKYDSMKTALAKAYNDYLVDRVVDVERGIYGGLVVPTWDVEVGVEELERYGNHPGIATAQGWAPNYRHISYEELDPVNDRLVDLDLPWMLHAGYDADQGDPNTRLNELASTFMEYAVNYITSGVTKTTTHMVSSGFFDKYPEINVVFSELGHNWMPYIAYMMDEYYELGPNDVSLRKRKMEADEELLDRLPSEYVYDNIYVNTQPIKLPDSPREAEGLFNACKADQTWLFSTDFPHSTMDIPSWVFDHPKIDNDLRKRILHENAEEVYRL